jgi:hypothetical protein
MIFGLVAVVAITLIGLVWRSAVEAPILSGISTLSVIGILVTLVIVALLTWYLRR